MHYKRFRDRYKVRALFGVLGLSLSFQAALSAAQQLTPSSDSTTFVTPTRRPAGAVPRTPATVPAAAEQVVPLTLEVVTTYIPLQGRPQSSRQSVSRTRDRIHLTARDGREWLFVRNSVDPRRVSGMLIDHASRSIVVHEESDLRSRLGINGWAEALLLGLDPAVVSALEPSKQTRMIAGVRFTKQSVTDGAATIGDVWWNADLALPGAFAFKDASGSTRVSVERIVRGVKDSNLEMPSSRFPSYTVLDLAEWLEVR